MYVCCSDRWATLPSTGPANLRVDGTDGIFCDFSRHAATMVVVISGLGYDLHRWVPLVLHDFVHHVLLCCCKCPSLYYKLCGLVWDGNTHLHRFDSALGLTINWSLLNHNKLVSWLCILPGSFTIITICVILLIHTAWFFLSKYYPLRSIIIVVLLWNGGSTYKEKPLWLFLARTNILHFNTQNINCY